jgi:dihydropteroate synthase
MAAVAAKGHAAIVLMHLRGTPQTMQQLPPVGHIVEAVRRGLAASLRRTLAAGIPKRSIVLDPGIGFGKTAEQNFELIRSLPRLAKLGYPLLVGPSRKFFIRKTLENFSFAPPSGRRRVRACERDEIPETVLFGTAAAITACILNGAQIVRVHDVRQMLPVTRLADRLRG